MTKRQQLIAWLGDAHAMEVGIISTLEKHIADAKGHPEVTRALKRHLAETKKHATAMKRALASLDASPPVIREGIGKVVNLLAGISTSVVKDTPVKNAIADFATEHFEIACYTSLVQTATAIGETKIAQTCKGILHEEQAMAKTLTTLFPKINAAYLATLEDEQQEEAPEDDANETVLTVPKRRPATKKSVAKRKQLSARASR